MHRLYSFITLLIFSLYAFATIAKPSHYLSHQVINHQLVITTTQGTVTLSAYGPQAIETLYQVKGQQQLASFAIAEQKKPQAIIKVTAKKKSLTFATNKLNAIIEKSPFRISYFHHQELLLAEETGFFINENKLGFRFHLNDTEKLLGGGERVIGMNRRGHQLPLYNKAHYGYSDHAEQMYFGLPAVMSTNKYILLFDNSAKGMMDLAKTEKNIMQFEAIAGRSAYLVFAGDSYPELIHNYVNVTGKQPLPPRWALGNYASRFGYHDEQEVRSTVDRFIAQDFPLDAIVLDLYWFGKEMKGHMGNLAWDKQAFPSPKKMIKDLKDKGVETIVITEPFVLTSSKKWSAAVANNALAKDEQGKVKTFDFYFGNTGLIDIFNKQGRSWFAQSYQKLSQQGINGWWGDLGEPEVHPSNTLHTFDNGVTVKADTIHNVYGHQWAKMLYQQQLNQQPNQRPFIMMRSGFAGSQRYGMIPWTGDVSRQWAGLAAQVELSLQMSLFGLAYTHSDLGGFAGDDPFDAELYIRWLQYGVFQPVYRPHGQENIAAEPVFHEKNIQDILRPFIKLRYQLLPYNYSLAYQNSLTGMPLMRPLFFENENNLQLIDNNHSYLWGDAFLISPIVQANIDVQKIYLPKGVWFDFWTDQSYQGGQTITMPVELNKIPVLVRAGAFIPMIAPIQSTKAYNSQALTLHYYADSTITSAEGRMYEDDGHSRQAIAQQQFEQLDFNAQQQEEQLNVTLTRSGEGYLNMPSKREMTVIIHHWLNLPKQISLNGKNIRLVNQADLAKQQNDTAYWDNNKQQLIIKITWQKKQLALQIN